MDELSAELLTAVHEIRDLLRLLVEPAIAQRDEQRRVELRQIVGNSVRGAKAVLLMDGSRTQSAIQRETGINQGQLSKLVKRLTGGKLISGGGKEPKLAISIPANFFGDGTADE